MKKKGEKGKKGSPPQFQLGGKQNRAQSKELSVSLLCLFRLSQDWKGLLIFSISRLWQQQERIDSEKCKMCRLWTISGSVGEDFNYKTCTSTRMRKNSSVSLVIQTQILNTQEGLLRGLFNVFNSNETANDPLERKRAFVWIKEQTLVKVCHRAHQQIFNSSFFYKSCKHLSTWDMIMKREGDLNVMNGWAAEWMNSGWMTGLIALTHHVTYWTSPTLNKLKRHNMRRKERKKNYEKRCGENPFMLKRAGSMQANSIATHCAERLNIFIVDK